MSWIPSEIRTELKDGVNDKIVPALRTMVTNLWNNTPQTQKDELIQAMRNDINGLESMINSSSPTLRRKISSPS